MLEKGINLNKELIIKKAKQIRIGLKPHCNNGYRAYQRTLFKKTNYFHASEYLGFDGKIELQYLYRTLDILSQNQELLKQHLFTQQQNLFTQSLDVVFYDVTTLYFDSQKEKEGNLRQKGYSKDGKSHKTTSGIRAFGR